MSAPTEPALGPPVGGEATAASRWQALVDGVATLESRLATAGQALELDQQALLSTLLVSLEKLADQLDSEIGGTAPSEGANRDVLDLRDPEATAVPNSKPSAEELAEQRGRLKAASDTFIGLTTPGEAHGARDPDERSIAIGQTTGPRPTRAGLGATVLRRRPDLPVPARRWLTASAATALTAVGLVMVAFVVFQFWVTDLTEARNQRQLRSELSERLTVARADAMAADPGSGVVGAPDAEGPPEAGRGSPVGVMKIPAIGLNKVVVEGSGANDLKRGPGHYRGTPLPGHAGNVVVAGRRTTYGETFRSLDKLKKGATIDFVTTEGAFTYRVEDVKPVRRGERDVLAQTAEDRLTLVTSNPKYRASSRLAVFARLEGAAVDANLAAVPRTEPATITSDERGLTPDVTAAGFVLLWGQLFAVAFLVTRVLYRRWRPWSSWLVTTPVVLALTFLFFESLDRLLPSTL